ncbi:MAG: ribosome recycling factor [Dehalococcoidia bacterium]|nr:MAG: ribosome recycling factor [Dehalococcoidia bacterium]
MIEEILLDTEEKMEDAVEALKRELASIRTGRASPALIEHVKVEYAGSLLPIKHIASVSVSGASLLLIQPWDPTTTPNIEKALLRSNLGLTPSTDGSLIRLNIPPLTEERRLELRKLVKKRVEEGKISIRGIRRDGTDRLKQVERNKEISQDEHKRASNKIQLLTDNFVNTAEQVGQNKEAELMEV